MQAFYLSMKSFLRQCLLPVFLLLLSECIFSQAPLKSWNVSGEFGYVYMNSRDEYFSDLEASGSGIAAALEVQNRLGKARVGIDFHYRSADMKIRAYKNFAVQSAGFSGSLFSLWDIKGIGGKFLSYSVGPFLNFFHSNRDAPGLINYNSSFESAFSLGIANEFLLRFGDKGNCTLNERLNFSLASFYRRPDFGNSRAAGSLSGSWEAATLNRFRLLQNELSLLRRWKQHSVGLGYDWNYYTINNDIGVMNANHCVRLIYSISL
jgi:hypothetical protein